MIKKIDAMDVIKLLNELLEMDREGITKLIESRVPVNRNIWDHPTVQVLSLDPDRGDLGILGFLNGLFANGKYDCRYIYAEYDKSDKLISQFALKNIPQE